MCLINVCIPGTRGSTELALSELAGGNEPRRGSPELAPTRAPHADRRTQRAGEVTVCRRERETDEACKVRGFCFSPRGHPALLSLSFCSLTAHDCWVIRENQYNRVLTQVH